MADQTWDRRTGNRRTRPSAKPRMNVWRPAGLPAGRACATHPWRVVFSWIGIVVLLVVLVATVGGSLKDEFDIPGSDTQKATDLIEAEFASEQGGVLNVVFAAPEGERLDTTERKAAIESALAKLETSEFEPTEDTAGSRVSAIRSTRTPSPTTVASPTPKPSSTG